MDEIRRKKYVKGKNSSYNRRSSGNREGHRKKVLWENGANVIICDRCSEEAAAETEKELKALGTEVVTVRGDVTDPETAKAVADKAKKEFGGVDILVNNAGITNDKLMMRMKPEDFYKGDRRKSQRIILLHEGNVSSYG